MIQNMEKLKISIVTPSYNCGKYIERAIKSVIGQDYDNFEYFIIDGGSTDDTLKIIKRYAKRYPKKIKWVSEPDKGQTDAINKGLRMSTGSWFAWLNADDFYEQNVFSKLADVFREYQNAGVIYGNCHMYYSKKKITLSIPPKCITYRDLINRGSLIYGPASFFNMKALKKVGEFNENLHYWMDYEMYIRISKIKNMQYVNLNIANFRIRKGQKSRIEENRKEMEKEAYTTIRRYNWKFYFIPFLKKIKSYLVRTK